MTAVRLLLSLFVALLVAISVAGWVWTGNNQAPEAALASRVVLGIGMLAGIGGVAAIWRRRG